MDLVDPEKVKPLPVWYLVAFVLVWTAFLSAPELAWDRLEPWPLAGLFAVLALLLLLLVLEHRRRCGVSLKRYRDRLPPDWPFTMALSLSPGLVIGSSMFLPPPVFIGLALGSGVLVAFQLRRINEGIRAEVAAGR